ncbi:MAG: hypothetical protein KME54_10555 [Tolypothrix brevis GSE-NOS-MK-07-07A]|nr:hypothetical protein [Tolypothrix brevis GSE-NOS-MK-07-07A]
MFCSRHESANLLRVEAVLNNKRRRDVAMLRLIKGFGQRIVHLYQMSKEHLLKGHIHLIDVLMWWNPQIKSLSTIAPPFQSECA